MTDPTREQHPELEQLAAHFKDALPEAESAAVSAHLEGCAQCRLELLRLARFEGAEQDEEALRVAQWEKAEADLQDWRPAAGARPGQPEKKQGNLLGLSRNWHRTPGLVPLAVAAVLVLMITLPNRSSRDVLDRIPSFDGDQDSLITSEEEVMRGGGSEEVALLALVEPLGYLETLPEQFTWQPAEGNEVQPTLYTLTIFTEELESVFVQEVPATAEGGKQILATPDELRPLIEAGRTYLWGVRGYRQMELVAESPSSWFMIGNEPEPGE
jgi:hypothetical protein